MLVSSADDVNSTSKYYSFLYLVPCFYHCKLVNKHDSILSILWSIATNLSLSVLDNIFWVFIKNWQAQIGLSWVIFWWVAVSCFTCQIKTPLLKLRWNTSSWTLYDSIPAINIYLVDAAFSNAFWWKRAKKSSTKNWCYFNVSFQWSSSDELPRQIFYKTFGAIPFV